MHINAPGYPSNRSRVVVLKKPYKQTTIMFTSFWCTFAFCERTTRAKSDVVSQNQVKQDKKRQGKANKLRTGRRRRWRRGQRCSFKMQLNSFVYSSLAQTHRTTTTRLVSILDMRFFVLSSFFSLFLYLNGANMHMNRDDTVY